MSRRARATLAPGLLIAGRGVAAANGALPVSFSSGFGDALSYIAGTVALLVALGLGYGAVQAAVRMRLDSSPKVAARSFLSVGAILSFTAALVFFLLPSVEGESDAMWWVLLGVPSLLVCLECVIAGRLYLFIWRRSRSPLALGLAIVSFFILGAIALIMILTGLIAAIPA